MESKDLVGDIDGGEVDVTGKTNFFRSMSLTLANPTAREWFHTRRENIRSWATFVNTSKFKVPQTTGQATKRVVKNIEHFQSNYFFVFFGLILYCLITSPLLLIAAAASLGLCYIISLKNSESQVRLFGRDVTLAQQYGVVGLISFPLFYLAGAGTAVFWVLGVSFFFIMLHAVLYNPDEESMNEEEKFEVLTETV